jgi:hypothetical protein
MSHIFISYAREDQGFVDDLVRDLEARGLSCWIDRQDIPGGATWRAEIATAISECLACLVVVSPDGAGSAPVQREVALAESLEKKIIPLRYKSSSLPAELQLTLARLQWIDFDETIYEDAFADLMRALSPREADREEKSRVRRPAFVYVVSTVYAVWGLFVLYAYGCYLYGITDESGQLGRFFEDRTRLEVMLSVAIAVVHLPSAILLLKLRPAAFPFIVVGWALNSISIALTLWIGVSGQERLGAMVTYAFVSYAAYYTYTMKREGRLSPAEPSQPSVAPAAATLGGLSESEAPEATRR